MDRLQSGFSAPMRQMPSLRRFSTLSMELQLGMTKGAFSKKVGNEDDERQREVVDLIPGTNAWKRSGLRRARSCILF